MRDVVFMKLFLVSTLICASASFVDGHFYEATVSTLDSFVYITRFAFLTVPKSYVGNDDKDYITEGYWDYRKILKYIAPVYGVLTWEIKFVST